jgi:hypothetical protein
MAVNSTSMSRYLRIAQVSRHRPRGPGSSRRFAPAVVTLAETLEPITTMGGVRMLPDALVGDLVTAGPDAPVQFARATLERVGRMSGDVARRPSRC